MGREYLTIGPVPPDENCAQVGADDYEKRSRLECEVYIDLLRRTLGPEPEGARLASKSFPHDYGSYREVICYYDPEIEAAVDYAFKCEGSEGPMNWDEIAQSKLQHA